MEPFSPLKYWRGGGGAALTAASPATASFDIRSTTSTTTINPPPPKTDDDRGSDEGPFFDLDFTIPSDEAYNKPDGDSDEEEEREVNFVVSSDGSCGGDGLPSESCLSLSPSNDLFFNGRLVPFEPSSLVFSTSEHDFKHQLAATLLKSATKFRVFLPGFRKPKFPAVEPNVVPSASSNHRQQHSNFFIKFKVEEMPLASLFTRDNSSRISGYSCRVAKLESEDASATTGTEDKFTKGVLQKYLNKIKPLYIRVSRRYVKKLAFSGLLSTREAEEEEELAVQPVVAGCAESEKPQVGHLSAGLRAVLKHPEKNKSASSADVVATSRRRDDTLLLQQDGIQSAIAHCKQSFNSAPKGVAGSESSLVRSISDPVRSMSDPDHSRSEMVKGNSA